MNAGKTSPFHRYIKGKPEREASFEVELANPEVARKLYDLRTKAGLSRRGLAKREQLCSTAWPFPKLEETW
jgi:hypothetical protein